METRYIAALEIGSSKIHGAVAAVNDEGRINVLASESLHATDCVRYGRVSNVQEVSTHVNTIIRKLENNPAIRPNKITELFISLGGRSFSTIEASATLDYGHDVEITADAIHRLKDEARFGITTNKMIVDLVPRRYFVNNKEVSNIVGSVGSRVRAEFTALLCAQDNRSNLERIKFDSQHMRRAAYLMRHTAIADMVLEPSERSLGCVLADFGAETTTVGVYKHGSLQFAITLPLGSRNVTRDLMSGLSLTEDRAEQVKLELGNAINERHGGSPLSSEQVEINQYVQARTGEIIANVIHQIESAGYKSADLPAGIIAVGGGTRLRNFTQALTTQSKMKVRTGTANPRMQLCDGLDPDSDTDILSLIAFAAANTTNNCLLIERPTQEEIQARQAAMAEHRSTTDNRQRPADNRYSQSSTDSPRQAQRRDLSDDDPDLLSDDDDDTPRREKPKKEGFFARLRRKQAERRRRQLIEQEERAAMPYEEPNMDDEPTDYDDDETYTDDNYSEEESNSIVSRLRNNITKFLEKDNGADLDDNNN